MDRPRITQLAEASPHQQRRRWRQFSLKTLLILLTLFCLWFGTWANNANRQRRAVEAIERSGGQFVYDYQRKPGTGPRGAVYDMRVKPPGPQWLRRLLGDHYFITAQALNITRQRGIKDDCLACVDALPYLESAMFSEIPLHDADVAHLKYLRNLLFLTFNEGTLSGVNGPRRFEFLVPLTKLRSLSLVDSHFGDSDAKYLAGMTNLETLFLYNSPIGDDALAQWQHLEDLEMLGLGGTKVTDRGMAYLSGLPKLRYIAASKTSLSDAALAFFPKMSALEELELYDTKISREGIERLRKAMPHCRINGKGGAEPKEFDPFGEM